MRSCRRSPNSQLAGFVAEKRRGGLADFSVKSFSYESDRKWQPLKEKPVYYPIVYMEPMPAGSEDVIGLDVDSVPFLRRAMIEPLQRRASIASHPFRLVEGNLAYVVFSPIPRTLPRHGSTGVPYTQGVQLVDMVIDAANLIGADQYPVADGGAVFVYHKDFRTDDPKASCWRWLEKPEARLKQPCFLLLFIKNRWPRWANLFPCW